MSQQHNHENTPPRPLIYQIWVSGHLDQKWEDWFDGVSITLQEDGETLLTCTVVDQAALHALLTKVRNLGMPLIAVYRVKPDQENNPDIRQ
jgi:hypothetical protein